MWILIGVWMLVDTDQAAVFDCPNDILKANPSGDAEFGIFFV